MNKYIPISLIIFRFICVPVILLLAYRLGSPARIPVLILMYLGLISDIFDGIIARKLDVSTEKLRRLDSQVDLIFWLAIGFAVWFIFPDIIRNNKWYIISLFVLEGFIYLLSFIRFKREISTHSYLSKFWGITLLLAFTAMLGFRNDGFWFYLCVTVGIVSQLDVILIILILPKWTHDIPSAYHAYLIRKNKKFKRHKLLNG